MVHLALPSGSSQISPEPITILVDVYSAVSDTLTIEDLDTGDTAECVTDANGVGTATLTAGHEYCFTSSKAKGLDGHSDYCKYITPAEDTTEVKVMPDGNIFWKGKHDYPFNIARAKNGGSVTVTDRILLHNNMNTSTSANAYYVSANAIDFSGYERLKAITSLDSVGEGGQSVRITGAYDALPTYSNALLPVGTNDVVVTDLTTLDVTTGYINLTNYSSANATNAYFDEIWLEKKRTITNPQNVTLTLEGAKEDKITIYDKSWNVVDYVDFASGSTTATKTIAIKQGGEELIFVSSVAKNTDGDGQYSKVVEVSGDATVKVMPDGALYWYGNEVVAIDASSISEISDWTNVHYTSNSNSILLNPNNSNLYYSPIKFSIANLNGGKVKAAYGADTNASTSNELYLYTAPNSNSFFSSRVSGKRFTDTVNNTTDEIDIVTNSNYVYVLAIRQRKTYVNAIWLE